MLIGGGYSLLLTGLPGFPVFQEKTGNHQAFTR